MQAATLVSTISLIALSAGISTSAGQDTNVSVSVASGWNLVANPLSFGTNGANEIFSPIDGHPITMYDTVSAAAQQAVKNVDSNDSNLSQRYDGFEVNFSARLPKRGRIFGGSATDRAIANTCSAAATNPNLLNYCDQT